MRKRVPIYLVGLLATALWAAFGEAGNGQPPASGAPRTLIDEKAYTNAQKIFAGKFGAALVIIGKCGRWESPVDNQYDALRSVGLRIDDFDEGAPLRATMLASAANMGTLLDMDRDYGKTDAEIADKACGNVEAGYGPHGNLIPNLAVPLAGEN